MTKKEFSLLNDKELIWACAEPIVLRTRAQSPSVKAKVFLELSEGQRALFIFQVLYGHAGKGMAQFFAQISYLTGSMDLWQALKTGMKYFGAIKMLELIERAQSAYSEKLPSSFNELDKLYFEALPETLGIICGRIRKKPDDFISLDRI